MDRGRQRSKTGRGYIIVYKEVYIDFLHFRPLSLNMFFLISQIPFFYYDISVSAIRRP